MQLQLCMQELVEELFQLFQLLDLQAYFLLLVDLHRESLHFRVQVDMLLGLFRRPQVQPVESNVQFELPSVKRWHLLCFSSYRKSSNVFFFF